MADVKYVNTFPVFGVLGIILIVLKLLNMITLSWWLVTLPFWFPWAVVLGFVLGGLIIAAVVALAAVLFG